MQKFCVLPNLGCLASKHEDIRWHKGNKSVSPTQITMIMPITMLEK